MQYTIKFTKNFKKRFRKIIPNSLQDYAWTNIWRLTENPFIGKPLGDSYFRELKIVDFRIYFIIYQEQVVVMLADVSNKKQQQDTIDMLKKNRELLHEFIKNLNKE